MSTEPTPEAVVYENGHVIDPATGTDEQLDVVIVKGQVEAVGRGAGKAVEGQNVKRIDASKLWLMPGFTDLHVHFREPGQEYKEDIATGLAAAARGGFVAVCAMPNTKPVNDTRAITEQMVARAREVGGTQLHPIGAITRGLQGHELTEMSDLREAGAVGVSDDGRCVMNAAVMRRALEYARTVDVFVSQHAEDHDLTAGAQMHEGKVSSRLGLRGWPAAAEDVIVARDLILAELTGARYHVAHISSLGSLRYLAEAKSRGLRVSAEVTPHHLTWTDDALASYDTHCKVNPPLRSEEHRAALIEALSTGLIDCVATDHAPHTSLEKDCEFDAASPGVTGLETALPLLLRLHTEGRLSRTRLVEALANGPARVLGRAQPRVVAGGPASLVVFDPTATWILDRATTASKSLNTPLATQTVTGRVLTTWASGRIIFQQ